LAAGLFHLTADTHGAPSSTTGIVGQQKAERLSRQHLHIDGGDLAGRGSIRDV
jgi:hypothetical protein